MVDNDAIIKTVGFMLTITSLGKLILHLLSKVLTDYFSLSVHGMVDMLMFTNVFFVMMLAMTYN